MENFVNNSPLILVIVFLVIGFCFLIKGADFFVEGSSSIAKRLLLPPIIIGLTIVAMGTSLPETAVSVSASIADNNELAISNVVGSNIFNLMFVVGICAILSTITVQRETVTRDIPFSMICALLLLGLGILALGDRSGMTLGRLDGIIFLALFAGYILVMIRSAMKARSEETEIDEYVREESRILSLPRSLIYIVGGSRCHRIRRRSDRGRRQPDRHRPGHEPDPGGPDHRLHRNVTAGACDFHRGRPQK